MIEVVVVGEGQTEETFIRDVLKPHLAAKGIYLEPRGPISTSAGHKGGALSRDRVLRFLRNTLRERPHKYVTTLFDLYGLRSDFPGVAESATIADPIRRCESIERNLAAAAISISGCREDRFLPHIQPYEFEALLFSDVLRFAEMEPEWGRFVGALQEARDNVRSPEHINDGADTHPSARLKHLLRPSYRKPLHGSGIAQRIGIARMRSECRHFDGWLTRVESLALPQ